jgi:Acyl-CoA synthetases (AMP-forming)/AMP-acid ligases II
MMKSTIMDYNLSIHNVFWRAEKLYPDSQIVSRVHEGKVRYTYSKFSERVRRLSQYLREQGVDSSSVVGTIAWNTHRHLELYFSVPLLGGVLHTINVRFHPSEMEYVINFAGDKLVFYDVDVEEVKKVRAEKSKFVRLDDEFDREVNSHPPLDYFPEVDEREGAVMCFTSGTTGHPKGVVYSHRSIFIHSLSLLAKEIVGISSQDIVMPVVPMFHISAWDVPFASLMTGAKLVLPGPRPGPDHLASLIREEGVTVAIGAPTVWINLLDYLRREKIDLPSLKVVVTGGAEPPKGLIKGLRELGIRTYHAWGMTETEAITTVNQSENIEELSRQGKVMPGIEVKIVDPSGNEIPWDGKSWGELVIRGAWVTGEYFNSPEKTRDSFLTLEGKRWFRTGDVVVLDPKGSIKVVDRAKDLIKSGGEWISSVDLENAIMTYEPVLEAAVVGVPDLKWGERPVALVVLRQEYRGKVGKEDVLKYLESMNRFPKWWLPDEVIFVDSIPKTSTGKLDKKVLRTTIKERMRA